MRKVFLGEALRHRQDLAVRVKTLQEDAAAAAWQFDVKELHGRTYEIVDAELLEAIITLRYVKLAIMQANLENTIDFLGVQITLQDAIIRLDGYRIRLAHLRKVLIDPATPRNSRYGPDHRMADQMYQKATFDFEKVRGQIANLEEEHSRLDAAKNRANWTIEVDIV